MPWVSPKDRAEYERYLQDNKLPPLDNLHWTSESHWHDYLLHLVKKKDNEMYCFGYVLKSPVIEELVQLAANRAGIKVFYENTATCDENVPEQHKAPQEYFDARGSVWVTKNDTNQSFRAFWDELDRLTATITKPLDEPILSDDYPLVQGYLYVANGKPRMFIDGERQTVGSWKQMRIKDVPVVTEVRRCDIFGRRLRLPPEKEKVTPIHQAWIERSSSNRLSQNQKRRKPRNSNKIKKVR